MSLPHALLAALIEAPGSGLDLANRFDSSIGYFWNASHQQIYRELGRMEEAGWIRSHEEAGRGRKKSWQVLAPGRHELRRWAGQSEPRPTERHPLLVRLWAEAIVGQTHVDREIRAHLDDARKRLAHYREIDASHFENCTHTREQRLQRLVLQAGIGQEAHWVEWLEQALEVLADE